jgi:hypothetical protein
MYPNVFSGVVKCRETPVTPTRKTLEIAYHWNAPSVFAFFGQNSNILFEGIFVNRHKTLFIFIKGTNSC